MAVRETIFHKDIAIESPGIKCIYFNILMSFLLFGDSFMRSLHLSFVFWPFAAYAMHYEYISMI